MEARPFPGHARAQGIDVSHYQGAIDWNLVVRSGMAFAFIKATEGTADIDPQFLANWLGANAAGLLRGAYHSYRPGEDPRRQAMNFLKVVQLGPGDLPPVLEVELPREPSEIIRGIGVWLTGVELATGKTPILYTDPSAGAELVAAGFHRFPLWIAECGAGAPIVPREWNTWSFWRYSEAGLVPGVQGPVALHLFQGTLPELRQVARLQA